MADHEDERDEDEREDEDGVEDGGDEASASGSSESEGADDDGGSDTDASEAESPAVGASSAGAEARSASPAPATKPGERASAGARVAAAKAAKAAKKAAKKAALAEERRAANAEQAPEPAAEATEETPDEAVERQLQESPVGQAALRAQDWLQGNQTVVAGVAAAAAVGVLGWLGYGAYQGSVAASAAAALEEAVEISQARVVAEGDEEADTADDDERTFETTDARGEAALEAYRRVVSEHGGTDAAAWAQLGVARLLLEQGEPGDAREAYEAAVAARGSDPVLAMRAYEGIGFTYEAEENWDEARDAFDRIRGLRDGAYAALADYHLARLSLANGDDVAAQEALETLVESVRSESESAEPEFPYVLAQAQTLLRQLDPSSSDGSDSVDIEEMIRRMMAERAAGGAAGGAGE